MKTVLSLAAAIAIAGSALSAQAGGGQAADEAAIRKLASQYESAWNSREARLAAALFTNDALFITPTGEVLNGRAAIEKDLSDDFSKGAGDTITIQTETVRFLRPDLAVSTGTSMFRSANMPEAGPGHWMVIAKKVGGEWKVSEVHAAAVPAEMASPTPRATGTAGRSDAAAEAELIEIEDKWADAVKNSDTAFLERIYADNYTWTDPEGRLMNRSEDLNDMKSGNLVVESHEQSNVQPRIFGDTAVVTGVTTMKGKYKGEDISGRYRWTDTFVRQNGEWKVVASQATRIAESK